MIEKIDSSISRLEPLIAAYKQAIGEEALTQSQLCALEGAVRAGSIVFFAEHENGEYISMCSVSRTFSTYNCAYSGVFEDFYVMPQRRKSGAAGRLTRYVFDYCQKNGIMTLWVGCADCDVEMYEHLGFDIPLGNLRTWSAEG